MLTFISYGKIIGLYGKELKNPFLKEPSLSKKLNTTYGNNVNEILINDSNGYFKFQHNDYFLESLMNKHEKDYVTVSEFLQASKQLNYYILLISFNKEFRYVEFRIIEIRKDATIFSRRIYDPKLFDDILKIELVKEDSFEFINLFELNKEPVIKRLELFLESEIFKKEFNKILKRTNIKI